MGRPNRTITKVGAIVLIVAAIVVSGAGAAGATIGGSVDTAGTDDSSRAMPEMEGPILVRPRPTFRETTIRIPAVRPIPVDHGSAVGSLTPVALASADFDEDGVADLVCAYKSTAGGTLTLHRGNVDALFPNSPGARLRRELGTFVEAPFYPQTQAFDVGIAPDFVATGDFDNDGHQDILVTALAATSLYLLTGDGDGGLRSSEIVGLPGKVTALAVGEINRADSLTDVVVGIRGRDGYELLVFEGPEGALRSTAEVLPLPMAPTVLTLGRFHGGPWYDLAAAGGNELFVIQGRDRRLDLEEPQRAMVAPPLIERIEMPAAIEGLAWGDFVWEPMRAGELALLLDDGTLQLLGRESDPDNGTLAWNTIGRRDLTVPTTGASPSRAMLLPIRLSGAPIEDLAVLEAGRTLQVIAGMVRGGDGDLLADEGVVASTEASDGIAAILPMRLNRDALTDLVVLQPGASTPLVAETTALAMITVNSAADTAIAGDGQCTLREAILNANSDSDVTTGDCVAGAGADAIEFNILGGGAVATIAVLTPLPEVTDPVTIDGTTQGCATPPCVVLNGIGAIVPAGLHVSGGTSSVRGLVLRQFRGIEGDPDFNAYGIWLDSSGNLVEGNYLGTDATGTVARGNEGAGVRIEDGWVDNTIGGTVPAASNVISAALIGNGVTIRLAAEDNVVQGNFIGTDITGQNPLGSVGGSGVTIHGSNNTIGGTTAGARNVISDNAGNGVYFPDDTGGQGNLVLGNHVGTDVDGTDVLGNGPGGFPGVWVGSINNTVGGTAVGSRNLISGNFSRGVLLTGASHKVLGNYIGTDVTGTLVLGNAGGVYVGDGEDNTIGGTTAGARNLISGNTRDGIFVGGSLSQNNFVLGNYIGTDLTGTADLGNLLAGVETDTGSTKTTIGGTTEGARNVISGNDLMGVLLEDTSDNTVLGNYIGTDANGTADLGNTEPGVWIVGSGNTIGGTDPGARNIISGNDSDGVFMTGAGATGNTVVGNYIGVDVTGLVALGNAWNGVEFQNAANNTIGGNVPGAGNVISNSTMFNGIHMFNSTNITVLGNLIGTDATGTVDMGNTLVGVRVVSSSNVAIGGTSPGDRNIISGNGSDGVFLANGSQNNEVLGNYIGTDVTGTVAMPNDLVGIEIDSNAMNNTVGGASPGMGNLISGNAEGGIFIQVATQNSIVGNLIGTDASGTTAIGNGIYPGIEVWDSDNTIGGLTPGARNVISGNQSGGITFFGNGAVDNQVLGNYIGTQIDGVSPLGNTDFGVRIAAGAARTTIGGLGTTPGLCNGPCNRIGFSVGADAEGIQLDANAGNGNSILGNTIFSCGAMGVDLANDGVTPNDDGDTDSGPNALQNYPVLTLAESTPSGTTVEGSLNTAPNRPFHIEFFANQACDASGHGEGFRYIGFADVTTDATGNIDFSVPLTGPVSNGEAISATATAGAGNTSEFSQCLDASCLSTASFGQTILAADRGTIVWTVPDGVRFVKGDLAGVSSYVVSGSGELPDATAIDMSADQPPVGVGLYYLVRSLACGSWQNEAGSDPGRDVALP